MQKIASIDIGTNTVRLLVLEQGGGGEIKVVASDQIIVRLGEGMDAGNGLLPARMDIAVQALVRFKRTCEDHGVASVYATATSAVREAPNREEFLKRVFDATGLRVRVIPWEEEARTTLRGVFWKLPVDDRPSLSFDIGGGSTEFILSRGDQMIDCVGTKLGAVRLTEKFITQAPTDPGEYEKLAAYLKEELKNVREKLSSLAPERIIGTAGTATTLAALDLGLFPYDPEKVHGHSLSLERIESLSRDLRSKTLEERLAMKPIEPGREDLLVAGTAIVLETLSAFGAAEMTVSDYGLREGILLAALGG